MATPSVPQAVVIELMHGAFVALMLRAVAELEIADRLGEEPRTSAELAAATGTDAGALGRTLRALAACGVVRVGEDGRWSNTPVGDTLRAGATGSVRDYVLMLPHEGNLRAWSRFADVLRTGLPSFEIANGCDHWAYLERDPDLGAGFHRAMSCLTAPIAVAVTRACDPRRFRSILDIAGGQATLLASLLEHAPAARGALLETRGAIAAARATLEARGLAGRVELVAGDMFEALPPGHDAHVLKHVLHDWDDERAGQILRRSRAAIAPGGRVLVVDAVLAGGSEPNPAVFVDVHMMTVVGGRERTEPEWRALLHASGYRLDAIRSLPAAASVIEASPV
jgi:hypothetical protein